MNKNKLIKRLISTCMAALILSATTVPSLRNVRASELDGDIFTIIGEKNIKRLYGDNRFKTCIAIADSFTNEKLDNVVISSAYGYADALSGSVLAKKLNAPMILVGRTVEESKDAIDYITKHLNKDGKIYILGGTGVINNKFVDKFKQLGYAQGNIKRLGGKNRTETCKFIANEIKPEKGKGIIISADYGFADALSASAPAAINGYPILLSSKNSIPKDIKNIIKELQPSEIYIVGGQGVLTSNIEKDAKELSKNAKIIRLGGKDRYETSYKIVQQFKGDKNESVLIASGKDFPDALSGAPLAAKLNAQLILVNENSINTQKKLIDSLNVNETLLLGGNGAISKVIEKKLSE